MSGRVVNVVIGEDGTTGDETGTGEDAARITGSLCVAEIPAISLCVGATAGAVVEVGIFWALADLERDRANSTAFTSASRWRTLADGGATKALSVALLLSTGCKLGPDTLDAPKGVLVPDVAAFFSSRCLLFSLSCAASASRCSSSCSSSASSFIASCRASIQSINRASVRPAVDSSCSRAT